MDKAIYNSQLANSNYHKNKWMLSAIAMAISNLLLVVMMVSIDKSEKTIIVPENMQKPFWVQGERFDPIYLEQLSNYFFQLLLTYNKSNAQYQFESLLRHVSFEYFAKLQALLLADVARIGRNEVSSVFYPMGIKIAGLKAVIEGQHLGMVGEQVVQKKMVTYSMQFKYQHGRIMIESFDVPIGKEL